MRLIAGCAGASLSCGLYDPPRSGLGGSLHQRRAYHKKGPDEPALEVLGEDA
jgi:hypothetical protein